MKQVYLDHAATTYVDPEVLKMAEPYFVEHFGNPSSLYSLGRTAKVAIEESRATIAKYLGADPMEIIFNGSGTESDNMAILGIARAYKDKGNHIIVSSIEHHAILDTVDSLKKEGFEVTLISVGEDGIIKLEELEKAITDKTILVSVMYANNEIGTIQPLAEISKIIAQKKKGALPYFHTDAAQAAGYLDLNVTKLGVDLLSFNGSKIYGFKGTGALYVKKGVRIAPQVHGGGQERNLRSGTENVAGIVGLAKALELAQENKEAENNRLSQLRDYFTKELVARMAKIVVNGSLEKRLPGNVNVSILDIEGEALLLYLDAHGIYCSTGSACTSQTLEPSHVILALGRPYEYAHGSIRFSLGRKTTKEDLDYALETLPPIVELLRKISPVNLDVNAETDVAVPEAFVGGQTPHFVLKERSKKNEVRSTN